MSDNESESSTGSVTAPPTIPPTGGRKRRPWLWLGGFVLVAAIAVTAVFSFWTRPYYALAPGSVRATASRIDVQGANLFPPEGELGFVTVSLTERVTMWEYIQAKVDDSIDLVEEDIINGDRTGDEKREEDRRRMQESKDTATLVALNHLGYEIIPIGLGIEVVGLTECMPAESVLELGDLVIGIDGAEVAFSSDLIEPLGELAPGDTVELTVDRFDGGIVEDVELTLGSSANPCLAADIRTDMAEERALIGIQLSQMLDYELPLEVAIDTDRVGGPSAGLAFTLAVIDVLTPGELTGGAEIATTGTIDLDGNVGRVGGVKQKTVAARDSGVALFLVPVGERDEALQFAGDMKIVEVATLADALDALGEIGGNTAEVEELAEAQRSAGG